MSVSAGRWSGRAWKPCSRMPAKETRSRSCALTVSAAHSASCSRLSPCSIALLSLKERIDTNSAAGELVFHVFGAVAHFERRLIAERTRDGLQAAAAKGRRPGRPQTEEETISSARALIEAGLPPARAAPAPGL